MNAVTKSPHFQFKKSFGFPFFKMTSQNVEVIKKCQCYLTLSTKKHDIQKFRDFIRSNSEKRDSKNKQKICFFTDTASKDSFRQVFKPTFHKTIIIFL